MIYVKKELYDERFGATKILGLNEYGDIFYSLEYDDVLYQRLMKISKLTKLTKISQNYIDIITFCIENESSSYDILQDSLVKDLTNQIKLKTLKDMGSY